MPARLVTNGLPPRGRGAGANAAAENNSVPARSSPALDDGCPCCGEFLGSPNSIRAKDTVMLRDDSNNGPSRRHVIRNVLGEPLEACSIKPMTGFYRDGCCNTGREDIGSHTVCVVMTSAFLDFSKSRGNDLSTPMPELGFLGLKPGDRWCLCAPRWQEALDASQAPRVVLRATHEGALAHCSLADLKRLAVDLA